MMSETKYHIKVRKNAWDKFQRYGSVGNYRAYKIVRNRVNRMIKADQRELQGKNNQFIKEQPEKFYGYMRRTQTVKMQMTQLKQRDGMLTETYNEAAVELCNFFKEVFIQMRRVAKHDT